MGRAVTSPVTDDDDERETWHPLAFRGWEDRFPDVTEPLTPDVARAWLEAGVPTCRDIVVRHGMRKWMMRDPWISQREEFVNAVGFAVPCKEAIAACVAASPLLEIGAGTGFWSALIAKAGGDIIAVDDDPDSKKYAFRKAAYHPVLPLEATDAVAQNPDRDILLVWPCYQRNWAAQVAKLMQPGRVLLLVSEGPGGCVGDDDLFDTLDNTFDTVDTIPIPVWPGIGDHMTVHRKHG